MLKVLEWEYLILGWNHKTKTRHIESEIREIRRIVWFYIIKWKNNGLDEYSQIRLWYQNQIVRNRQNQYRKR